MGQQFSSNVSRDTTKIFISLTPSNSPLFRSLNASLTLLSAATTSTTPKKSKDSLISQEVPTLF